MFPTFISFTNRHPRFVAVIGLSVIVLCALLLGYVYLGGQQSEIINPPLPAPSEDEIKAVEMSLEEKMANKESLEESLEEFGVVAPTDEEKMKILESLKSE